MTSGFDRGYTPNPGELMEPTAIEKALIEESRIGIGSVWSSPEDQVTHSEGKTPLDDHRMSEEIDNFYIAYEGLVQSRTRQLISRQVAERSRGCMDTEATRLAAETQIRHELTMLARSVM